MTDIQQRRLLICLSFHFTAHAVLPKIKLSQITTLHKFKPHQTLTTPLQTSIELRFPMEDDKMQKIDEEEVEEYKWREVILPSLIPKVPEPELERESVERRRGRDVIIAVDHGPYSKHAFDWCLAHFCRIADTLHLVHAVSSVKNEEVYEATQVLMETLAVEAFQVLMVKSVARIVEGDAEKVICREAEKLHPAAVVMGTRGRGLVKSVLKGSVSEYCFHHCKAAPIIIVPGKETGEASTL